MIPHIKRKAPRLRRNKENGKSHRNRKRSATARVLRYNWNGDRWWQFINASEKIVLSYYPSWTQNSLTGLRPRPQCSEYLLKITLTLSPYEVFYRLSRNDGVYFNNCFSLSSLSHQSKLILLDVRNYLSILFILFFY